MYNSVCEPLQIKRYAKTNVSKCVL